MAEQPDFDRLGDLLPQGGFVPARPVAPDPLASDPAGADPAGAGAAPPEKSAPGRREPAAARRQLVKASPSDFNQQVASVWAEVVGPEIAANARPVQLREGRLVVTTSSSAWAQTLQLMSEMVIAGLNTRLGAGTVGKAVFRHAGWEEFPVAGVTAAPAVGVGSASRKGGKGQANVSRNSSRMSSSTPEGAAAPAAPPPMPSIETGGSGSDEAGFSKEERQALAELELLRLSPAIKASIREAMVAGFVRARQDSGRS